MSACLGHCLAGHRELLPHLQEFAQAPAKGLGRVEQEATAQQAGLVLELLAALIDQLDQPLAALSVSETAAARGHLVAEESQVVVIAQALAQVIGFRSERLKHLRPERA